MPDPTEFAKKPVSILIVEDSATQREELQFLLEEAGFAVVAANNGKEGLAAARLNGFSLVISDVVMPEMDGYSLCNALRADESLQHLPLILLTSLADTQDVIRGLESGANNFVSKPYDGPVLLARVREVLANHEIRKTTASRIGSSILFAGQRYSITADRTQILDFLLSTYADAVHRNDELIRARSELRLLNEQLEAGVAERTAALTAEITERKRAEDELQLRNLILSTQQEASLDGTLVVDADGKIISSNQRFADMWGISPEVMKSKSDERALQSVQDKLSNPEEFLSKVRGLYASPHEKSQDEIALRDGRTFDRFSAAMIGARGQSLGRVWHFRDITARKHAERELLESKQLVESIVENVPHMIFLKEAKDLRFVVFNRAGEDLVGHDRKELLGRNNLDLFPPEQAAFFMAKDREVLASDAFLDIPEEPIQTAKKGLRLLHTRKLCIKGADGVTKFLLGISEDITDRKQAEGALKASEERHRTLFESSHDAIMTVAPPSWRFGTGNPATLKMFEVRDEAAFTALGPWDLSPELQPDGRPSPAAAIEMMQTAMAKGSHFFEWTHRRLGGESFPCTVLFTRMEIGGQTLLQATVRDISERRQAEAKREKLEAQLRASQKMEAIGSLAGGVAHDFNNLLSVILIYTGLAIDAAPDGDPRKDDLLEVKKAAKRAESLTRQLLAFSRKQVLQPVPLDLNETAAGLEKMLRRILGEDIDFLQVLAPGLGIVQADPGQIEQVLMNLAVNARDAMPEGGKLTIETANVEMDEEHAALHAGLSPGPYVLLTVADTGTGMDEATKARLFEPFFTTKPKGKGTGLGLSTVYGIVKQSGGYVSVYSELGHGTTFKIYLPRALSVTAAPVEKRPIAPTRTTGTETIIVVEDEEALRKIAVRSLAAAGYTVLSAADGDEALEVCERHAGDIALLLTDVVMPRMSGRSLAQALSKARPALKVVYMSGYTDDTISHHGVLDPGTQFLGKPFTAADLTLKVREVLDTGTPNPVDGHAQAARTDDEPKERPFDMAALRALPSGVLGKLRKAVVAARHDEIVDLVESIRTKEPEVAASLRRMADHFDYQGLRDLLSRCKEEPGD